ncbi:YheC/YheD family protein [Natronincola peptidivorans]|uniref:YheC/YheD family protein n=1 Tax=Natronincola peptidivorans TaxID=426128 RepID=UPI00147EBFCD|nr:YheC/YheD family protein [Natronincola peptidivorans]
MDFRKKFDIGGYYKDSNTLIFDIPTIAITGSSGKTTTRAIIFSILETKWKVLKTVDNKNLPFQNKQTLKSYDSSYQAVLLEFGMGRPGVGKNHCNVIQPNISIITNIGTAHYGNFGNSVESTAKNKSYLIKYMHPRGTLLLNNDDENSKLLETKTFAGKIITIGIRNKADYQASNIRFVDQGVCFQVALDRQSIEFFIPAYGLHNVYNALVAIAVCHHLKFSPIEIQLGLKRYQPPIKRLNFYHLSNASMLIDDTVNANPESVKTAIDVLIERGEEKKKIVVLGSMLELGEYEVAGHIDVGGYLAKNDIDLIYTFGKAAKSIMEGAIKAGFPTDRIQHFSHRVELHAAIKQSLEKNSIILVKGSSKMKMDQTAKYIRDRFLYSVYVDSTVNQDSIYLNNSTLQQMNIASPYITFHFGAFAKNFPIQIDPSLKNGVIRLPKQLSDDLEIPAVPCEYYMDDHHLHSGPVIGLLVLPRYYNDPPQQLLRFADYDGIKGLVFLCKQSDINIDTRRIEGYYYTPETEDFVAGTFPYPSAFFNRTRLKKRIYRHLQQHIGDTVFNYPYGNTDKWSFYKQMSEKSKIIKHLPNTVQYVNIKSLIKMLRTYPAIYMKPTTLAGGNGILYVKKLKKGFLLSTPSGSKQRIHTKNALAEQVSMRLVKNKKYIVQQAIPYEYKGKKIDFRVYIQKDETKNWKFSGMETKIAKSGSIISNSKNREAVIPGEEALMKIYGLSEKETVKKIIEITKLCIKVLNILEKGSHIGDAAIDLIIDGNGEMWILEVQLNYAAEIKAFRLDDEQAVLPNILPTPLKYAKSLTGF